MSYIGADKIGKMFLGDTEIAKACLGTDLVFQKGGASNRVPYIRGGSDGSYIDTGITPDQTTKVIVWARNWNPGGASYTWLFGSRVANQDSMFGLTLMSNANTGKIRLSYGSVNTDIDSDTWHLMSHYRKYELSSDGFYVDDNIIGSVPAETFSNNYTIHLFGLNNGGTRINPVVDIDIVACKIYKGGVLVRDYTAVRTPSIGLYDAVSDTVFTNAGSGAFTFGRFNPDAYSPLKSISMSGNSYFVTSEIGKYSTPILIRCRSTVPSAAWNAPLGGRGSTNRCEIIFGNDSMRNARLYGIINSGSATAIYSANTAGYYDVKTVNVIKTNNVFRAYYNYAELGSGTTGSTNTNFSAGYYIAIGASKNVDNFTQKFHGYIMYARVGKHNYVPASVNGVAGMYDTYNDVFRVSETDTPFTAGSPA